MFKILPVSHLDHGLTQTHLEFLQETFGQENGFFIRTVEMPAHLPDLSCGLHGPIMGEAPVLDSECTVQVRGTRLGPSRLCKRPLVSTRLLTVIAGQYQDEPCVLFTAYGGPLAPREPWEPMPAEQVKESVTFWAEHALTFDGE